MYGVQRVHPLDCGCTDCCIGDSRPALTLEDYYIHNPDERSSYHGSFDFRTETFVFVNLCHLKGVRAAWEHLSTVLTAISEDGKTGAEAFTLLLEEMSKPSCERCNTHS